MPKAKRTPIKLPSAKYLRERLTYTPETGILIWRKRPRKHFDDARAWKWWNTKWAGMVAGAFSHGYRIIDIDKRTYGSHRIIWKMMTGKEPPASIDHRDGNPANNRWSNLRAATPSQQSCNVGLREDNISGFKGVSRKRSKWRVRVCIKGIEYQRTFNTLQQAVVAYKAMARKLHTEFYHQGVEA